MEGRERAALRRTIAFSTVLACAAVADILCLRHPPEGTLRICLTLGMHLLFLACFTDRRSSKALNLLKLAYILQSMVNGGCFSLTCGFLILFEVITRKERKDGPDGK